MPLEIFSMNFGGRKRDIRQINELYYDVINHIVLQKHIYPEINWKSCYATIKKPNAQLMIHISHFSVGINQVAS